MYYARSIDPTMLMALNSLAVVQKNLTIETAKQITQLLNYSATHPYAIIEYKKSGMILQMYYNAFYISEPEARSRAGGYFSLGPNSKTPIQEIPPENGPVHVEFSITRNFLTSATEEELVWSFENCQKVTSMRISLSEMVHLQPPTPVETENTAANNIFNGKVRQRRSCAIDMIFYWFRDRIRKKPFPHILGRRK